MLASNRFLMGNVGNILRTQFRDRLSMVNDMDLAIILQQQEEVEPADQALIAGYQGKTLYAGPLVRYKKQVMGGDLRQKLGLTPEQKVICSPWQVAAGKHQKKFSPTFWLPEKIFSPRIRKRD